MIIVPTEKRFDWKHAPVVLIALVVINVLVFVLYQSGDGAKAYESTERFVMSEFVELEWPIFETYLENERRLDELRDYRRLHRDEDEYNLAQVMLMDTAYYQHVLRAARNDMEFDEYQAWKGPRKEIQEQFHSISSFKFGLKSTDVSIINLLTYQFLHGGVGHIFGNMIFLLAFGFAVEAAIGSWRFLLFYLVAGVAAGLAQVWTHPNSEVPLVGASGSISGVMAMYLAVFRLKKIEFFYWVLFFVGYFRAPALAILPFYFGKEVVSYLNAEGSNIAFMAHAGGVLAGALLIGVALIINRDMLNQDYIEEDQSVSFRDKSMAEVFKAIEALRFDYALKLLDLIIEKEGLDFQLALQRFHLEKINRDKRFVVAFRALMRQKDITAPELALKHQCWLEESMATKLLPIEDQLSLAFQFTSQSQLKGAEAIFENLYKQKFKPNDLILLANKMATQFAAKRDNHKSLRYQEYAQHLAQEGHHGVL